ncbi:MAG: hypothetical protein Q6K70_10395 [Thermostichales cyanobacterium DRC_bins_46]
MGKQQTGLGAMMAALWLWGSPGVASPLDPALEAVIQELRDDPDLAGLALAPPPPPRPDWRVMADAQYLGLTNPRFENIRTDSDSLALGSIALMGSPAITPDTQLLITLGATLARFGRQTESDFNRVNGSIGINWRFDPTSFVRLDVQAQNVHSVALGSKFFSDIAVQFRIGQTQNLPDNLTFTYFYQARANFADPNSLNRVGHSLNLALGIPLSDQLNANLSYRFLISNYTIADRRDIEHQLSADLRYQLTPNLTLRGFTTYVNNSSSDNQFTFDSFAYGLGFNATIDFN